MSDDDTVVTTRMRAGEALAADLRFLAKHGLNRQVTLIVQRPQDYLLDQIADAVRDMAVDAKLAFPAWQPEALDLDGDNTNREMRIQFHELPFRFVLPGNANASLGQRYIRIDHSFSFQSLQFSIFQKRCSRVTNPADPTVGLLYICASINTCCSIVIHVSITLGPKGGPIVGPVNPGSPVQHYCFANRIMAHLVQGINDPLGTPDRFQTVTCKASCPEDDVPQSPVAVSYVPSTPSTSVSAATTSSSNFSTGSNISSSNLTRYHNRDRSASPGRTSAGNMFHTQSQSRGRTAERLTPYIQRHSVSSSPDNLVLDSPELAASSEPLHSTTSNGAAPSVQLVEDIVMDLRPVIQYRRHQNRRTLSPLRPFPAQPGRNSTMPLPDQVPSTPSSSEDRSRSSIRVNPNPGTILRRSTRSRRGSHTPLGSYDDTGSPIIPFDTAAFVSIDQLRRSIDASVDVGHSTSILRIEAESIIHAANGLVGWLGHQRLHMDDSHPYKAPNDAISFVVSPDAPEDRLNIFSKIWQVQA